MSEEQQHAVADTTEPASQQSGYNAPFAVNISFPKSIIIKMVDASTLNDYEVLLFVSTVLFGLFGGFIVEAIQSNQTPYIVVTAILFVGAAGAFIWALIKRHKMTADLSEFKIKTSGVEQVRPSSSSNG